MALTRCEQANESLTVEQMADLIRHAPPGPWPPGWASWANTNAAMRLLADEFAQQLLPHHDAYPEDRGIVIAAGGLTYLPGAWVCIRLLRHLGCTLPIQLWHLGPDECDPYFRRLIAPYNATTVDARTLERIHPCRILCGWELKPYAALHSPYNEVLFLDADNCPTRDPTYLFDAPPYKEHGAAFWPDYACWTLKRDVWEIFGMPEIAQHHEAETAFESGQFLVHKGRCWRQLRMSLWYAEHSDYVFRIVYGDKECFHLGWRRLNSHYAMPPYPPGWNTHTILQHDWSGRIIFQHRCQDKWRLAGNRRTPGLEHEDLCLDFLAELRELWTGTLWENPRPTPTELAAIRQLTLARFLYRRVGHDERPMQLLADNHIGEGAAECERRWWVNDDEGTLTLTLSRIDRPTCHLHRDPDGTWRGHWLHHEKMPIELIPLDSPA
jgi:hypothetical protein